MCSVATPDTQLFAISTSKTTEKNLNNLQKQKTENSECAYTHLIEKTISICWYYEYLSRYHNKHFYSVLYYYNPFFFFYSTLGMPGSSRKHPPDKTESICYSVDPYANLHTLNL